MASRNELAAVNIELIVYKLVLCVVVIPVFGIVAPLFLLQQAVVEAYRLLRRLAFLTTRFELPAVEQIRFEGHGFYYAAGVMVAALITSFVWQYRRAWLPASSGRQLPDVASARRFRELPASLAGRVAPRIERLWHQMAATGAPPGILCFASTGLAACVTERNARPVIALSTGLLDRMAEPSDRLTDAIVLHELAHVISDDDTLFRRTTAFVAAFRSTFMSFIVIMAVVFLLSSIAEITDLGGIEKRSPSIMAYFTGSMRELVFPYVGMLLVLRYIALIVMLTELRADLHAAIALGGLSLFAAAVRNAEGMRNSTGLHLVQSLAGTRVSHLTAQERLSLLERPERLQSPKYRYFIASIALAAFLLVNGALAFSGFDWVLQVGIVATISAVNAITVAMAIRSVRVYDNAISGWRAFVSAFTVVAINALLLFDPSEVMGSTSEVIVALTDPTFARGADAMRQTFGNWYVAAAKPVVDTFADGRAFVWLAAVTCALTLLRWLRPGRAVGMTVAGGCLAALLTPIVAAGAPFATYLWLPQSLWGYREQVLLAALFYGPPLPLVAASFSVAAFAAIGRLVERYNEAEE